MPRDRPACSETWVIPHIEHPHGSFSSPHNRLSCDCPIHGGHSAGPLLDKGSLIGRNVTTTGNCSIFIEKIERLFTVLESTIFSRQNDKSTRPLMKLSKLNMRTLERERMRKKWRLPGRKSHLILFAFFPLLGISSVRMTQTQTNTQEMMKDHTVYFMLPLGARHISNTLSGVSVFSRCIEPRLNWAE